jgi:hypothetical protein
MNQRPDQQQHHPISSKRIGACQTRQENPGNNPSHIANRTRYQRTTSTSNNKHEGLIIESTQSKPGTTENQGTITANNNQNQPHGTGLASMVPIGTIVPKHSSNLRK